MIRISSQDEQLLREAVASGRFKSEAEALNVALRLLFEKSEASGEDPAISSGEKWLESFHAWTRRERIGNPKLDDSRGSIYE